MAPADTSSDSPVDSIEAFRRDMFEFRGLDVSIIDTPGVTVVPEESRAGSRIASAYVYGRHFVIFVDPACADRVRGFDPGPFEADTWEPLERYETFATTAGIDAEVVGSGVMRVLTGVAAPAVRAPMVGEYVSLDRDLVDDVARIQALVDSCPEDEVDDAAIEMDELDPVIRCVEAAPGAKLIAYASAFPDDDFGGRWDIGVLTHPEHRRKGLGVCSVHRLVTDLVADGQVPIYRHDRSNTGSAALSTGLGFEVANRLVAIRFPDA